MATETSLNRIVKGAPPPDTKIPPVAPLPPLAHSSNETLNVTKSRPRPSSSSSSNKHDTNNTTTAVPDTALSSLPSSPPQIYLNLLILEASLRSQYLHLLSRRRLNTFFLLLLVLWNVFFTWALFLRPREDGTGHGGSVYWVVETGEKVMFMGGIVTVLLVKATGQWERGIRWPRRWLGTTNRGLRGFNLRVVATRGRWWADMLSHFAFLLPLSLWQDAGGSDWNWVEHENGVAVEEDLAKGGDHVMLLLLPKNFSSEFRENWEGYRTEYWDRENERRTALRKKVKQQRRQKAKEQGGWKWWTGTWRLVGGGSTGPKRRAHDLEKHPQHSHSRSHSQSLSHSHLAVKDLKQSRRRSIMRDSSHSRQSSRSTTPHATMSFNDVDGASDHKPLSERVRRGSSVSSTSSVRRSTGTKPSTTSSSRRADGMLSPLTAALDEDEVRERERRAKKREREKERDRQREQEETEEEKQRRDEGTTDPTTRLLDQENVSSSRVYPTPDPA